MRKLRKPILWFTIAWMCNCLAISGQSHYKLSHLDFNSKSKELAPSFYRNGLVFCSDRRNEFLTSYIDYDRNPLTNLYYARQKKSGKFENPELVARELTTFMFEGPSTFSRDGNIIYFTRSIDVSSGNRNRSRRDTTYGIFMSRKVNGSWTTPTGFNFNSGAYNTGYPYITDDGSQLFFCSDAPGGTGGLDIYVSALKNGTWGKPENLGPNVNTSKNEVFPFLKNDGKLYFSSRGHHQQGDLDIYFTIRKEGIWQKPVEMADPFNTRNDDYGLILNTASDTGYFVSDRSGSPDIFAVYSSIPTFSTCADQKENDYCFVFFESNNNELDTTAFAYEWDMGDGTLIRALEADHCFARPDTYMVQLNIIDKLTKDVLISQATYSFTVEKIEQPYISCPDTIKTGELMTLNGRESYLKNFNISNYYWDLDDGTRLEGVDVSHSFVFPGIYHVRLGVTGQNIEPAENSKNNCVTRQIVVLDSNK